MEFIESEFPNSLGPWAIPSEPAAVEFLAGLDRPEIIDILKGHRDIPEYFSAAAPE